MPKRDEEPRQESLQRPTKAVLKRPLVAPTGPLQLFASLGRFPLLALNPHMINLAPNLPYITPNSFNGPHNSLF